MNICDIMKIFYQKNHRYTKSRGMIFLIDTVGKEAGMHQYNSSFVKELNKTAIKVEVLSNYKETKTRELFSNFYKGSKINKLISFVKSWFGMLFFYLKNKKNVFIYQSYGLRIIDMVFILIFSFSDSFLIIVHDVFQMPLEAKKDKLTFLKTFFYRNFVTKIICHSKRSQNLLASLEISENVMYFPHFNYNFNKEIIQDEIAPDVLRLIKPEKNNVLVFGQISKSKGIDVLTEALNLLDANTQKNINIIIAGMDKSGFFDGCILPDFVSSVFRYINDSELNYLFSECDFLLLPYRETYQSGVLELAVYFQIPAVVSEIEYFTFFSEQYPSFTIDMGKCTAENLTKTLDLVSTNKQLAEFYDDTDLKKYQKDYDVKNFVNLVEIQLGKESNRLYE